MHSNCSMSKKAANPQSDRFIGNCKQRLSKLDRMIYLQSGTHASLEGKLQLVLSEEKSVITSFPIVNAGFSLSVNVLFSSRRTYSLIIYLTLRQTLRWLFSGSLSGILRIPTLVILVAASCHHFQLRLMYCLRTYIYSDILFPLLSKFAHSTKSCTLFCYG